MADKIERLYAREVLDSRGNPTVECELTLSNGITERAIVPSGASTGVHEAHELRDATPERFLGKGVLKAVQNVNETIASKVVNKSFADLRELDEALINLDGTDQKKSLGANAILAVSLAYAKAVASAEKKPLFLLINEKMGFSKSDLQLPVPLMNVLNGGAHANNGLEFQEFMIVPHGFDSFREALRSGCEVFHHLKSKLHKKGYSTAVGDEGGFAPALESNTQALEILCEAIEESGYKLRDQISIALDVAASSFYRDTKKKYTFRIEGKDEIASSDLMNYYAEIFERFPIVSMEDGLEEEDWEGWKSLTERFGDRLQLVGDDLFVTNKTFVQKGIQKKVANAVLIKLNQIGTLSETLDTMALCQMNQYRSVVSHRSGETEDVTIAHLAVGSGCGQIKTGSASRSERTAKYNELLRIEDWAEKSGMKINFARPFDSPR